MAGREEELKSDIVDSNFESKLARMSSRVERLDSEAWCGKCGHMEEKSVRQYCHGCCLLPELSCDILDVLQTWDA